MKNIESEPIPAPPKHHAFLSGGGELGELMRSLDWSKTPVGPVETWPTSLKSTVRTILNSKFAMWLWWGPELVQFYNDAYRPSLGKTGEKHPQALGMPGESTWGEIWPIIKPQIDQVMQTGVATWNVNHLVPIFRNNILEEVYWTYSYSPVYDDDDKVGGVLVTVTETSQQVIGERQQELLRELAAKGVETRTLAQACTQSALALATNAHDLPFSLIVLVDEHKQLRLISHSGFETNTIEPTEVLSAIGIRSKLYACIENNEVTLSGNVDFEGQLPKGPWQKPPATVLFMPLTVAGEIKPIGAIAIGLNPLRLFDENYRRFAELISSQISSTIANAQVYEEAQKRAAALQEIDRAKTIFFSNVSHEFRTPLTLMLGPLQEVIQEGNFFGEQEKFQMIYRNGIRLQKLVNALLDFSRIEAGRYEASYVPVNISLLTEDLVSTFRSAVEKAGMKLVVNAPRVSENLFIDKYMWEKIVLNLLSNAFKFTFDGAISVDIAEHTNHVTVSVCDTGEGIAEKDIPHIFTRFKRIDGTRCRSLEGSGIGLSMVYELVKLHGGAIDVKSEPGKGSTFTITIPKGYSHLPKERIKTHENRSISTASVAFADEVEQWVLGEMDSHGEKDATEGLNHDMKPRVVIADDNADMRSYITRLLRDRFTIVHARDGKQALERVHEACTDLVITDIMMPGMDGQELLKVLKSNPQTARIPVIVLSARADEEAIVNCIQAGAEDYLVKPFSSNEFVARVRTLITSTRIKQETESRLYELFMQAPACIAVLRGPDLVFELANPPYLQVVGKERSILGKPIGESLPETLEQGYVTILQDVYRTGTPYYGNEMLVRLQRVPGRFDDVYFNFVYQPIRNSRDETEGILVHAVDVTTQVVAKKRIEESERKYRLLFETMSQGFCLTEVLFDESRTAIDYRFLEVNPVFEKFSGLSNVMGKTMLQLQPASGKHTLSILASVALTGKPVTFTDGSVEQGRWFENYAFSLGDKEGNKVGILVSEITDRVLSDRAKQKMAEHLEQTVYQRTEELIRSNEDLQQFAHVASHDLKEPVRKVLIFCDVIQRRMFNELPEGAINYLQRINNSAKRMKDMIDGVLTYSSVNTGDQPVGKVKLDEVLDQVLIDLEIVILESNAVIERSPLPEVEGAEILLHQLFYNLINNGLKFSRKHIPPYIRVTAEKIPERSNWVRVAFRDNGIGFPEGYETRIFSPFFRLHSKQEIEGNGLGLALCKKIVERHNGKIYASGLENNGALFTVELPIAGNPR